MHLFNPGNPVRGSVRDSESWLISTAMDQVSLPPALRLEIPADNPLLVDFPEAGGTRYLVRSFPFGWLLPEIGSEIDVYDYYDVTPPQFQMYRVIADGPAVLPGHTFEFSLTINGVPHVAASMSSVQILAWFEADTGREAVLVQSRSFTVDAGVAHKFQLHELLIALPVGDVVSVQQSYRVLLSGDVERMYTFPVTSGVPMGWMVGWRNVTGVMGGPVARFAMWARWSPERLRNDIFREQTLLGREIVDGISLGREMGTVTVCAAWM